MGRESMFSLGLSTEKAIGFASFLIIFLSNEKCLEHLSPALLKLSWPGERGEFHKLGPPRRHLFPSSEPAGRSIADLMEH